jgi:hypothetical protein
MTADLFLNPKFLSAISGQRRWDLCGFIVAQNNPGDARSLLQVSRALIAKIRRAGVAGK